LGWLALEQPLALAALSGAVAITAVVAAAATAVATVAPAVPVAGFALLPAHATPRVIDMIDLAGSNIFNKGAETLPICLANETSCNILFNLFKGYAAVKDLDFKEYIMAKKFAYEDSTLDLEEETITMNLAQNKFNALAQDGTCNIPSKEQEQIIALTATIESMARTAAHLNKSKDIKKKVNIATP
jgi:hypothetical protein